MIRRHPGEDSNSRELAVNMADTESRRFSKHGQSSNNGSLTGHKGLSRGAVRLCRELPLMVQLDDGRVVEGLADLAWTDGSSWTIVDYKTDSADQERYRTQIRFYALALQ